MNFSKTTAAVLLLNLCSSFWLRASGAAEPGAIGPTYSIAEESALDMIMNRLRKLERSGELKRLQEQGIQRSLGSIKDMKPVEGISHVVERSQRVIDPTVRYSQAIRADDGRIVVPAGTSINPLEVTTLTKILVFFDGRDVAQREAVQSMVAKNSARVKPILIAGSWLDLTKSWKTQVFYDQRGILSRRFGVRAVPSVIRQDGKMLMLDEIPAKELR